MADVQADDIHKRRRKRRKCGEILSHSGYYKHISNCGIDPIIQQKKQGDESESDTFTIHSGTSGSEAFQLSDRDEDLDIPVSVCADNPGSNMSVCDIILVLSSALHTYEPTELY